MSSEDSEKKARGVGADEEQDENHRAHRDEHARPEELRAHLGEGHPPHRQAPVLLELPCPGLLDSTREAGQLDVHVLQVGSVTHPGQDLESRLSLG